MKVLLVIAVVLLSASCTSRTSTYHVVSFDTGMYDGKSISNMLAGMKREKWDSISFYSEKYHYKGKIINDTLFIKQFKPLR